MIIERYPRPVDDGVRKVSDPILQELDELLDDTELLRLVRQDLQRHYSSKRQGRPSVPVEVTLRMTFLRRHKKWPYRQVEQEVRDSQAYRWWVRVYDQQVPDHTTLNDLERALRPQTLHRLNDRLIVLAEESQLTHGDHLRVDSSVTESNIHYPTDSSLLVDGVRMLSRCLVRAKPLLKNKLPGSVFSNHLRAARRRGRKIGQASRPVTSSGRERASTAAVKKSLESGLSRTPPNYAKHPDASPRRCTGFAPTQP